MRTIINAVTATLGGAVRHLDGFLRELGRAGPDHEHWLLVNPHVSVPPTTPNINVVRVGGWRTTPVGRFVGDQWSVPRLARTLRADVLLSILNFGPVYPGVPQIVFERNPIYYCPAYVDAQGPFGRAETFARRQMAHATMRSSQAVVVPSRAMRDMVRAMHPDLPADRFHVIPHGFSPAAFDTCTGPLPTRAADVLAATRDRRRVLYVSHPAPHKGFEVLIRCAAALRDQGQSEFVFLLTVAESDWPREVARYVRLIRVLGVQDQVRFLGRIPQQSTRTLYGACELFVFPSRCESFGFPMVEAMSTPLPILAAGTRLNREICGDAAVYYPEHDHAAMAGGLLRIASDSGLQQRLAEKGKARSLDFGWENNIKATLDLMELVAGRGV